MQASVIISYYKNLYNLELIFLALNNQTAKGKFEVIISEDDDANDTIKFLDKMKPLMSFPVLHISQKDEGFRKCMALNKALQVANTGFIIFIDGDCIPHKKLVEEYLKEKIEGRVLYGRRVMLSKSISKKLLRAKDLNRLNLLQSLLSGCKRIEEGFYLPFIPQSFKKKENGILLGCNMALFKKDLLAINGFDEDYISPGGGEDTDIEWRLKALGGLAFYSMKFSAIVYHIYHTVRFSKDDIMPNEAVVNEKIKQGFFICKNGIKKLDQ